MAITLTAKANENYRKYDYLITSNNDGTFNVKYQDGMYIMTDITETELNDFFENLD